MTCYERNGQNARTFFSDGIRKILEQCDKMTPPINNENPKRCWVERWYYFVCMRLTPIMNIRRVFVRLAWRNVSVCDNLGRKWKNVHRSLRAKMKFIRDTNYYLSFIVPFHLSCVHEQYTEMRILVSVGIKFHELFAFSYTQRPRCGSDAMSQSE